MCRRSWRRRCSYPSAVTTASSQCVAECGGTDSTTARPREQPGIRLGRGVQAVSHDWSDLFDQRHRACALSLGALVDQATRTGRGLAAHGPHPRFPVDVLGPAAGNLADPRRRWEAVSSAWPARWSRGCSSRHRHVPGAFPCWTRRRDTASGRGRRCRRRPTVERCRFRALGALDREAVLRPALAQLLSWVKVSGGSRYR